LIGAPTINLAPEVEVKMIVFAALKFKLKIYHHFSVIDELLHLHSPLEILE
jgi:hypothetical protein